MLAVLVPLFIAFIFVTSFLAVQNNNSGAGNGTTTIAMARTIPVFGIANAIISNYSYVASVRVYGNSTGRANLTLSRLQASGAISNYLPSGNTYDVELSSIGPYQLYADLVSNSVNAMVGSQAYVTLPRRLNLHYNSTVTVPTTMPSLPFTIYIANVLPVNSSVRVRIVALVDYNGTLYDNQIQLSQVAG